jgi:hypothetical protein
VPMRRWHAVLVTVRLKVRRRLWLFWARFAGLSAAIFVLLGLGAAVVTVTDRSAGAAIGFGLSAAMCAALIPAAFTTFLLATRDPTITADEDAIRIDHPGMFRKPLRLNRRDVHSVYVRNFPALRKRPRFEGSRWKRFWAWSRWVDTGSAWTDLPVNSDCAPDLSMLTDGEDRNLLIILAHPLPMRSARRGLGALHFLMRYASHNGPTRSTIARGLFGRVLDEDAAIQTFDGWSMPTDVPVDAWQWIHPTRARS